MRDDLRSALAARRPIQAMAAHSPLSAILAEEVGFEAVWASGFEFSALMGLPDISLVSMTQHLDMLRAMTGRVGLPVVADLDTGFGNALNVRHAVMEYERAGAAAVVIEDKAFPKVSSLAPGGRQELVRTEEFQGKIEAACDARRNAATVVVARTEALIAGLGLSDALARAAAYAEAGADAVLVHSKVKDPGEIQAFIAAWDGRLPLVLVPTAYPEMDVARMAATGKVGLAIWGNHAVRACVAAMRATFAQVRREGGIAGVEASIATVGDVFSLQGMERVKELEHRFLR
jgi:phosphoenolpyruvate phosphomutase